MVVDYCNLAESLGGYEDCHGVMRCGMTSILGPFLGSTHSRRGARAEAERMEKQSASLRINRQVTAAMLQAVQFVDSESRRQWRWLMYAPVASHWVSDYLT